MFKLHPAKKRHHTTSAPASHSSANAISSDFYLHAFLLLFIVFFPYLLKKTFLFSVAYLFPAFPSKSFMYYNLYEVNFVFALYHTPTIPCYLLLHHFGLFPSRLLLSGSQAFPVHSHMWKSEGRSVGGWFWLEHYLGLQWVDIQSNSIFPTHTHAYKLHTNTNKIISMDSDSAFTLLAIKHYSFNTG